MAERTVIIKKTPGDRLAPSGQSVVQSAGLLRRLESQAAGEFPRALSLPAGNPGVTHCPTLHEPPRIPVLALQIIKPVCTPHAVCTL